MTFCFCCFVSLALELDASALLFDLCTSLSHYVLQVNGVKMIKLDLADTGDTRSETSSQGDTAPPAGWRKMRVCVCLRKTYKLALWLGHHSLYPLLVSYPFVFYCSPLRLFFSLLNSLALSLCGLATTCMHSHVLTLVLWN